MVVCIWREDLEFPVTSPGGKCGYRDLWSVNIRLSNFKMYSCSTFLGLMSRQVKINITQWRPCWCSRRLLSYTAETGTICHYVKFSSTKRYRLHCCSSHLHHLIRPPHTSPCCALFLLLVQSQAVEQTRTCPFCFTPQIAPIEDSQLCEHSTSAGTRKVILGKWYKKVYFPSALAT